MSNEECCKFMKGELDKLNNANNKLATCVEKLFEDILAPHTEDGIGTDNMTCILIKLSNSELK